MKILVVDDEVSIRNILKMNLEPRGYEVLEASTGAEGLRKIRDQRPQLMILDLGLPDMAGVQVLREVRMISNLPVLVLTVNDEERTKVQLLESGADDYIMKPFSPLELLARIHVALRHHSGEREMSPVFESAGLSVDLMSRRVLCDGKPVHLTVTELNVLKSLIRGGGQVVRQDQILREVWGPNALENPHYLRIYIGQLRKKLERDPSAPVHILTEPAVGYRLV